MISAAMATEQRRMKRKRRKDRTTLEKGKTYERMPGSENTRVPGTAASMLDARVEPHLLS